MQQTTNQKKKGYSPKTAAVLIEASVSFIRSQIKLGKLKAKKFDRKLVILDKDLDAFLEGQEYVN